MKSTDMNLSLNGDTFQSLKDDFDGILARTVGNMEMKGADSATISIKLSISLKKSAVNGREVTIPTFEHVISSVMQVKDKKTGSLSGDYEIVYDQDADTWLIRKIDNGQTSLFNEDGDNADGRIIDAEYEEISDGEGELPALPQHEEDGEEDEIEAEEDEEEETAFDWLKSMVGSDLTSAKIGRHFVVKDKMGKIILSSATGKEDPYFCDKEVLSKHEGHKLGIGCNTGDDGSEKVFIGCVDCGDILYEITKTENAGADDADADGEEDDGYEYEDPESDE